MIDSRKQLLARKAELIERLDAIRSDLGRGLPADFEEQAIQLENMEVLEEIYRLASEELQGIERQLSELPEE